jgi:hypothetical protein
MLNHFTSKIIKQEFFGGGANSPGKEKSMTSSCDSRIPGRGGANSRGEEKSMTSSCESSVEEVELTHLVRRRA